MKSELFESLKAQLFAWLPDHSIEEIEDKLFRCSPESAKITNPKFYKIAYEALIAAISERCLELANTTTFNDEPYRRNLDKETTLASSASAELSASSSDR